MLYQTDAQVPHDVEGNKLVWRTHPRRFSAPDLSRKNQRLTPFRVWQRGCLRGFGFPWGGFL